MGQNHVNDPLYFYEAVEMFAFNYDWFYESDMEIDDLGMKKVSFVKAVIRGSLQPKETSLNQDTKGNTTTLKYEFYCMANYRIKIGDFIYYKGRFLHVDALQDLDEWGVRRCSLTMINLNDYKDLQETVKYLNGEKII